MGQEELFKLNEITIDYSETTYIVNISFESKVYRWVATCVKRKDILYVSEIYCLEYFKIKNSIKRKIRKAIEDAVLKIN